ncbi:protein FAR1-RELATED SEQUENCE 5-like [Henckelia pumila]|uniref:protein FAR1-RELATED SEQUENCE 5-like n=1 Tax=Henckelia pumila TaxID=405737 RepID=UPI003C6E1F91
MVNAGISVANAVSYMENEAQGSQNLGFIRKDAYDHLTRLKKHTKVENGDASALLHYFINKSNTESQFYWNVQLDDDNRVMNFFFRDYRCLVDYEYFGDVLSVDTTYRTNRYNLICAPFVGINHHRQNVMFGLAFMSDETEISFEWLFRTFLDSMNGKQPETVFTDQCQAMMNAICTVFPCAHHRLCQWHINQNAPSHLGSLNGESNFKQLWNNCMSRCESEEDFEATWRFMIDKYNLSGHKWLNGMYRLRYKWATAFSNHKFSAGLLATSRSECTNAVLKKVGDRTISLYDFVRNYEKIQKNWRDNEKAEDTRCHHGKASVMLKNNPLLNCIADVYSLTVYKLFEVEFINSLNTTFIQQPSSFSGSFLEFKVKSHGENSRVRQVVFNKETHEVQCSCHKFESMGILYKHALKVFNFMDVTVIPKSYIKKRWMKDA